MEKGTTVLITFLQSESSAQRALADIRAASTDGISVIAAAVITLRGERDMIRLRVEPQTEGLDPDGQRLIERLFPASILAIAPIGRQADAATDYYRSIGIESNPLKEVGENLVPSGAAVLIIVFERWLKTITRILEQPDVVRISLPLDAVSNGA